MDTETFFYGFQVALALFAAPWIIFSLLGTLGDSSVGFIDEWLLKKLDQTPDKSAEAPGKLLLISGFFGFIVCLGAVITSSLLGDNYSLQVPRDSMLTAIGAGMLEIVWMIPYFHALNRGGAINTIPLFQTIPVFSLLFGLAFFHEIPTLTHIFATFSIVAGVGILNYSPKTKALDLRTIMLMLFASATISLSYFLFKDSSLSGNFVATLFGNGLGMGILSLLIWTTWKPYRRQFNSFIKSFNLKIFMMQASNESIYAVSTISSQFAIVIGPSVMMVSALNAFHPVFTLLIGWCLAKFGSRDHIRTLEGGQMINKVLAVILIASGTIFIVL